MKNNGFGLVGILIIIAVLIVGYVYYKQIDKTTVGEPSIINELKNDRIVVAETKSVELEFECISNEYNEKWNSCVKTPKPTLILTEGDEFNDYVAIIEKLNTEKFTGYIVPERKTIFITKEKINFIVDEKTTYCEKINSTGECLNTDINELHIITAEAKEDKNKINWGISGNKIKGIVLKVGKRNITIQVEEIIYPVQ